MKKRTTERRQPNVPRGWVTYTLDTAEGPLRFMAPSENDAPRPADQASAEWMTRVVESVRTGARRAAEEIAAASAFFDTSLSRLYVPAPRRRWTMLDLVRAGRGAGRRGQTAPARSARAARLAKRDAELRVRAVDLRQRRQLSIAAIARHLGVGRDRVRRYLAE